MLEDRFSSKELLDQLLMNTVVFSSTDKDTIIKIIPELKPMVGCAQNHPAHVYDVFEHTIKVIEDVDFEIMLKLVALLHDSGKPYTKATGEDGYDHFRGHHIKSTEIAKVVLSRLGYDKETTERICILIMYHDFKTKPTAESIHEAATLIGNANLDYLFKFQLADMKGHTENYGNRKIKVLKDVIDLHATIQL